MKAIYDKLSQFYEAKIAGCSCGGSGYICTVEGDRSICAWDSDIEGSTCSVEKAECRLYVPCPTCAPLRERLKGLCWHEAIKLMHDFSAHGRQWYIATCSCGVIIKNHIGSTDGCKINIDLTTHLTGSKPTVRVLLEDAKLWDDFIRNKVMLYKRANINTGLNPNYRDVGDILTDLTLLCQAVDSFLQEVNSG